MSLSVKFNPTVIVCLEEAREPSFLKEPPHVSLVDAEKLRKITKDFENLNTFYLQFHSKLNKTQLADYHHLCKKLLRKALTYLSGLNQRPQEESYEKPTLFSKHKENVEKLIEKIKMREIDLFIRSKQTP